MKRIAGFLLCFALLFSCAGCERDVPQDVQWQLKQTKQTVAAEHNGVTMALERADTGSNTAVFLVKNGSEKVWYCGMDYALQVMRDGTWYEIDLYADASAEEVTLAPGEEWSFQVWWDAPYGALPGGTYRLVKEFYGDGALQWLTGWTLGCEFEV